MLQLCCPPTPLESRMNIMLNVADPNLESTFMEPSRVNASLRIGDANLEMTALEETVCSSSTDIKNVTSDENADLKALEKVPTVTSEGSVGTTKGFSLKQEMENLDNFHVVAESSFPEVDSTVNEHTESEVAMNFESASENSLVNKDHDAEESEAVGSESFCNSCRKGADSNDQTTVNQVG